MRVLVVEDDPMIASGVRLALTRVGHDVQWCADGKTAEDVLSKGETDLVVLDLGLPMQDGYQVLTRLRSSGSSIGVLILSARDALKDRVKGLDLGADDYLTKPFELEEFLARIRALERRRGPQQSKQLSIAQLTLDLEAPSASWKGESIALPRRAWVLLKLLMENPNRVYSRDQIQDALYGPGEGCESNAVDVHVHHLRKKIDADVVETVRGLGYRFGLSA